MAYQLKRVTIRTNNTPEGMQKIAALWQDITSGKLPILFDSEHNFLPGISPVSEYSNYECDEKGDYDLSVLGVTSAFFEEMEKAVSEGKYKKYDVSDANGDISVCTQKAWGLVWQAQRAKEITRAFTKDFESTVPAQYTKDGKAHCYLYIAVK